MATEQKQLWEVVGGVATKGIVVRKGRSTVSPLEAARLATGARIEELALEGDRLRYRRLQGDGPDTGWVSVSVPQRDGPPKELVIRVPSGAGQAGHKTTEIVATQAAAPEVEVEAGTEPPRPLPQDLPGSDAVTVLLREGTRQLRGVFCEPGDDGLFQGLRVELLRVEIDQDQRLKQTDGYGMIQSNSGPGRRSWNQSKRLPVHTFVLNKLADILDVEGLAWWTNLYEDAYVDCKFHRDRSSYGGDADNPNLKPDLSIIASFGSTRDFTLRHDATGLEFSFPQENGDVIAFNNVIDEEFLHGLRPAEGRGMPRIAVVMVGKSHDRGSAPKPLLPRFVSIWRPTAPSSEAEAGSVRWTPKLLQFSGKFKKLGPDTGFYQDAAGREVFQPHEMAWFVERGSAVTAARGLPGPGNEAFALRDIVKDVHVGLQSSVDQGIFQTLIAKLIQNEGGDRIQQVHFMPGQVYDPSFDRISKIIRVVWRGSSESDVNAKHGKLMARLEHDLGLWVQETSPPVDVSDGTA